MNIGHARFCLTPQKEFYLIGYRSKNRWQPATGVHDDIYANALLLKKMDRKYSCFRRMCWNSRKAWSKM